MLADREEKKINKGKENLDREQLHMGIRYMKKVAHQNSGKMDYSINGGGSTWLAFEDVTHRHADGS